MRVPSLRHPTARRRLLDDQVAVGPANAKGADPRAARSSPAGPRARRAEGRKRRRGQTQTGLRLLFSDAARTNPLFAVTWAVIIDVLQGMAIGTVLFGRGAAPDEQLAFLRELAVQASTPVETP